jgi:hypothetical protein
VEDGGVEGCRLLQGAAELGIMQSSNRPATLMARRLPRLVQARGAKTNRQGLRSRTSQAKKRTGWWCQGNGH